MSKKGVSPDKIPPFFIWILGFIVTLWGAYHFYKTGDPLIGTLMLVVTIGIAGYLVFNGMKA